MEFLNLLENNLNKTITRYTVMRYQNDCQVLLFLNKDLGLSLQCIGSYCGKNASAMHHYTTGLNSISDDTQSKLKQLLQFVLSTLEQNINKKKSTMPLKSFDSLRSLIYQGRSIINPSLKNAKTRQAKKQQQQHQQFKSTT